MYIKEKILTLSSSISPFPKNLSINKQNDQKIIISSAHKNYYNIILTNNRLESDSNSKDIYIDDNREVNDKHYIIQLKWIAFNGKTLLVVLLQKSIKIFNEENELLYNYEDSNESEQKAEQNQENSYSGGIAGLISSVLCIGTNNGLIYMFNINEENKISFDKTSNEGKHQRPITDLTSDQENMLISCDNSGKIFVFDYNQSKQLIEKMSFNGFDDSPCNCLGLYKNWLCAGYGSGHLRVFDIQLKSLVCEISAHARWITHLDIASQIGFVLSTSEDSFVRVWQLFEQNDSLKVYHRFSENIANHMLFGGAFVDSTGKSFCVTGYDSTDLHCFRSESCQTF